MRTPERQLPGTPTPTPTPNPTPTPTPTPTPSQGQCQPTCTNAGPPDACPAVNDVGMDLQP